MNPFDTRYRCLTCRGLHEPDYFAAKAGRNEHAVYEIGTGRPTFVGFCGPLEGFDPKAAIEAEAT